MTPDEAFKKFLTAHEHNDLPWEMQEEELRPTFMAGWHAHAESLKQSGLPLGGGHDYTSPLVPQSGHYGLFDSKPDDGPTPGDIYVAYPRKVGKQAAIKSIIKAAHLLGTGSKLAHPYLLERTKAYAAATARWPAADKPFIPHPATWFNRGSYEDDPKEWLRGAAATGSQFNTVRS